MMNNKPTLGKLLFILLFLLIAENCGPFPAGRITLTTAQSPPSFEFSGRKSVDFIQVLGPYPISPERANQPETQHLDLWRISPPGHQPVFLSEVPRITYGQLPTGWEQDAPKAGPPPPIKDGAVYYVSAILSPEGGQLHMCVLIREGQVQAFHGKADQLACDGE